MDSARHCAPQFDWERSKEGKKKKKKKGREIGTGHVFHHYEMSIVMSGNDHQPPELANQTSYVYSIPRAFASELFSSPSHRNGGKVQTNANKWIQFNNSTALSASPSHSLSFTAPLLLFFHLHLHQSQCNKRLMIKAIKRWNRRFVYAKKTEERIILLCC